MSTSTVVVSHASYLGAATVFEAKSDARYMLNGVCISPNGSGNNIVSTDGHHLIKIHDPVDIDAGVFATDQEYIVKFTPDQKRDLKKRANQDEPVTLDFGANTMTLNGCVSPIEVIDGKFPDYSKIIPELSETVGGSTPGFALKLLASFVAAHKVLGGKNEVIKLHTQDELSSARIEFPVHPNVTGVIMPIRC